MSTASGLVPRPVKGLVKLSLVGEGAIAKLCDYSYRIATVR
jgi:hypothetical protein